MMLINLVILGLVPRIQPLGLLLLGPRDKLEDDSLRATPADGYVRKLTASVTFGDISPQVGGWE